MTYPPYVRAKAIELRVVRRMSLDEIAERLALPKTTVWYWIKDIPLQRAMKPNAFVAGEVTREKHAALRQAAYDRGRERWPVLSADPTFREFVTLFIAEGHKRTRNSVVISNSDPAVILVCARWMRRLSDRRLRAAVQHHADQDADELRAYWGQLLGIAPAEVKVQRKSNSGRLKGRTWRSQYGVLQVIVHDTDFRSRLQAWVDCIKDGWT